MKKLILLLFIPLVFACSSDSADDGHTDPCPNEPQLITYEVSNINYSQNTDLAGATFSGEINNIQLGASCETFSITNQGFVYSTNIQPTTSDYVANANGQNASVTLNDLATETTYYVRAYLTNSLGTFYGNEVSFTTPEGIPIYLADNGVTVKARDWAELGMSAEINGITYTIVDESILRDMIENNEDVSVVCTTMVNNMDYLLYDIDFNQNISSWDVSNVTGMHFMFYNAHSFNQSIGDWDVSSVTDMFGMFWGANFNQPIGDWNVSNVTNMAFMFYSEYDDHTFFNQPIGDWNVSNVTNMSSMFTGNTSFNQPIGDWNVINVTDMNSMFSHTTSFNQPLNNWNVSNVTNMFQMFAGASSFNQSIGSWNVSNVTYMDGMFAGASSFNQSIGSWNVSNVTDMSSMFMSYLSSGLESSFNQDLSSWNVSNVTNMNGMFYQSGAFNQDLSSWNVSNVVECELFCWEADSWDLPKPNFTNCDYISCNPDCVYGVCWGGGGSFPQEVSWSITSNDGTIIFSGDGDNFECFGFEMSFGQTYSLNMYDSYGDGWNDASLIVYGTDYSTGVTTENYYTLDNGYSGTVTLICGD